MKSKRKKITATKYNQLMDALIKKSNAKKLTVDETLIILLQEASKYDLVDDKKEKKHEHSKSKIVKRVR